MSDGAYPSAVSRPGGGSSAAHCRSEHVFILQHAQLQRKSWIILQLFVVCLGVFSGVATQTCKHTISTDSNKGALSSQIVLKKKSCYLEKMSFSLLGLLIIHSGRIHLDEESLRQAVKVLLWSFCISSLWKGRLCCWTIVGTSRGLQPSFGLWPGSEANTGTDYQTEKMLRLKGFEKKWMPFDLCFEFSVGDLFTGNMFQNIEFQTI